MYVMRFNTETLLKFSPLVSLLLDGWTATGELMTWPTKGLLNFVDKLPATRSFRDEPVFTSFRLQRGSGKSAKHHIVMVRTPFAEAQLDTNSYQRRAQWAARVLTTDSEVVYANSRGELTTAIEKELVRVDSTKPMKAMNLATIVDNDKLFLKWCGDFEQVSGISIRADQNRAVLYEERELTMPKTSAQCTWAMPATKAVEAR